MRKIADDLSLDCFVIDSVFGSIITFCLTDAAIKLLSGFCIYTGHLHRAAGEAWMTWTHLIQA